MNLPAPGTVAGLLLFAAAAWFLPDVDEGSTSAGARPADEPLAVALAPLGPAKAMLSALLWVRVQQQRQEGEIDTSVPLSRALLALHPGLVIVREHLATRLILSDASLAPDLPRYRALVVAGLAMLENGQAAGDSPRLHEALGHLLAIHGRNDSRFWEVAGEYFGAPPEEIAIQELRQAEDPRLASLLLADLLLDRGFDAWELDNDAYASDRDLREAQLLIEEVPEGETDYADVRAKLGERIADLRERILRKSRGESAAEPPGDAW